MLRTLDCGRSSSSVQFCGHFLDGYTFAISRIGGIYVNTFFRSTCSVLIEKVLFIRFCLLERLTTLFRKVTSGVIYSVLNLRQFIARSLINVLIRRFGLIVDQIIRVAAQSHTVLGGECRCAFRTNGFTYSSANRLFYGGRGLSLREFCSLFWCA